MPRWLLLLAALALVARALLPAGFMPSQQALQDGRLVLTICSPGGAVTTLAPEPADTATSSADCAFALVNAPTLPAGVAALALPLPPAGLDTPARVHPRAPPAPLLGSPLGPRAPPVDIA